MASSNGNSRRDPLSLKRRSSFLSRNSSIEQIAFADPKEHAAYYNEPDDDRTPALTGATPRNLAHKKSLNALSAGRAGTTTPRPRAVRSVASFADRIKEESDPHRRPSPRLSDVSMAEQDIAIHVGDSVDVPGGMTGTVRFLGAVRGKKGTFAGIELHRQFASAGKNNGDVEGIQYFTTSTSGAGIFLPAHRATKASSPTSTQLSPAPTTPSFGASLNLNKSARPSSQSPQTPIIPKFARSVTGSGKPNFSQTVGPGTARATSPQLRKPASRPSLPRPESPLRKTPGPPAQPANRFTQSLRGGRPPGITPDSKTTFSASTNTRTPGTTRSPSRTTSRNAHRSPEAPNDDTPTARKPSATTRPARPPSQTRGTISRTASSQEEQRLRRELEDRDKQLKEQATALAEMESSLAELQTLASSQRRTPSSSSLATMDSDLPSDISQLRSLLREKSERIAALTSEFDGHRADFRSTIDTLEMASTETERVYEKRVQELLAENEELRGDGDVAQIAAQLKGLEELVAELEEGLEDSRREEAQARGEAEFLRGEVERGHSELRREREKAAKALRGAGAAVDGPATPNSLPDQRDDEIRGLKAIIHSLSSNPEASPMPNGSTNNQSDETAAIKRELEAAKRERGELQGLIDRKAYREEELEREISSLKLTGGRGLNGEDDTTPKRSHADSAASARTAYRPGSGRHHSGGVPDFPRPGSHGVNGNGLLNPGASRPGTALSDTFEDASEGLVTPARKHDSGRTPPPTKALPDMPVTNGNGGMASKDDGTGMAALTGDGPAPGRTTKVVDMGKWCALCERDGHDSVDCPFEEF